MTPQEVARMLKNLSPDELGGLDHATLYAARQYVPREQQGMISPYEHRAFAREATAENPLLALPIVAGIPLYQGYKSVVGARSAPSFSQVGQGLLGVGEGLGTAIGGLLGRSAR